MPVTSKAAPLALLSFLSFAALAQTNPSNIAGGARIRIDGFDVISDGWVENFNTCYLGRRGTLSGTHDVRDGGSGIVAVKPLSGSSYSDTVTAATIYSHCYSAQISATSDCSYPADSNIFRSGTDCAPPPPPPPPREPITVCDDGSNTGNCSPILINLAHGPYTLSGADDPVLFDIDADGILDRITWTARGTSIAFLGMDRNRNLTIDDGSELFGTATLLRSGLRASNGFEALKEVDSNGDGVLDFRDDEWESLLLWTDANHDGVSQESERRDVAGSTVRAIETDYHQSGRRDAHGNVFRYQGFAYLAGTRWPIFDVYFRAVP